MCVKDVISSNIVLSILSEKYSVFKNGNWNSPVNMGPRFNTASDEYRPVLAYDPEYKNLFIVFSSNKPGGNGGFDLYFTGFTVPQ